MATGFLKKWFSPTHQQDDMSLPEVGFELRSARASGVEKAWQNVQTQAASQGKYPVFLGQQSDLSFLLELAGYEERDVETLSEEGLRLDVRQWLKSRFAEHEKNFPYPYSEEETKTKTDFSSLKPFSQSRDWRGKPNKENVVFGLLPVSEPWLAPAYLKMGSMNDCPPAEVHVAILRYWFEQYGARPITLSSDIVECQVERPPATMEVALILAKEQYTYCPDNVWQGAGSGGNLARGLLNNHHWYFWWD